MRWIGWVFFLCACNGLVPSLDTSSQTQTTPSSVQAVHEPSSSLLVAVETVQSATETTIETMVDAMSNTDEDSSIKTIVENTSEMMTPPLLSPVSSVEPISWEALAKVTNKLDAKYAVRVERKPTGLWISWGAVKLPDTGTTLYYRLSSQPKNGGPTTEIISWSNQWLNPELEYDFVNQRYGYLVHIDFKKSYTFTVQVKNPSTDPEAILSYPVITFIGVMPQKSVYWVQPNKTASVSMDIPEPTGIDFLDSLCKQGGTTLNGGAELPFPVKAFISDETHRYACSNAQCDKSKDWVFSPNTSYRDYFPPKMHLLITNDKSISAYSDPNKNVVEEGYLNALIKYPFFSVRTVLAGINPDWTTSNSTCGNWAGVSSDEAGTASVFNSSNFSLNIIDPLWYNVFGSLPNICFSRIEMDTVNQKTVYRTTWKNEKIGLLCVEQ